MVSTSMERLIFFCDFRFGILTAHKASLRHGVDLISGGRRKSKRGNTGVPMICTGLIYSRFCSFCMRRVPYEVRRSVFDCCVGRVNHIMLSWFDLLLLFTSHTPIHGDYWHKGESLERGCRCTAAAILLLYCCMLTLWLLG